MEEKIEEGMMSFENMSQPADEPRIIRTTSAWRQKKQCYAPCDLPLRASRLRAFRINE